jgi:hypothetical protein
MARMADKPHDNTANALVARWRRTFKALHGSLRVAYLRTEITSAPLSEVARALDRVCADAEQADPNARELLIAIVDLFAQDSQAVLAQRLREEAAAHPLLSLARLLRRPLALPSQGIPGAGEPHGAPQPPNEVRVPDYGVGRTFTLGERKALARRPNRKAMDKLLADPHPAVIRTLLGNPKVVEDDIVRLAARRPNSADILAEIARSGQWAHRGRVRMAVILNPDTPIELSIPMLTLLVRTELKQVARTTYLAPMLRAAAADLLARRPPVAGRAREPKVQ